MTLECDAAFLAGFIVGTYDLRGDSAPPAYIQPFLDRVMKTATVPKVEEIIRTLAPPKPDFSEEAKATAKKIVGIVNEMRADEAQEVLPELTRRMLDRAANPEEPKVNMVLPERNTSADDEGEDRAELVRRLAAMGWTDAGIADKLGLSHGGVFQIRRRHRIEAGRKQKANGLAQNV
jgi:hypothetical protein